MLQDPQAAVGKLGLIRRAQRADRVALAAAPPLKPPIETPPPPPPPPPEPSMR
jgi:hypothetical protein